MTYTPLLLSSRISSCVSVTVITTAGPIIVQLVHDLILLINATLQSITKHPKTWVGRKKQNGTCAENSKLSDLEGIKHFIIQSTFFRTWVHYGLPSICHHELVQSSSEQMQGPATVSPIV
jgi:hypothetical protein